MTSIVYWNYTSLIFLWAFLKRHCTPITQSPKLPAPVPPPKHRARHYGLVSRATPICFAHFWQTSQAPPRRTMRRRDPPPPPGRAKISCRLTDVVLVTVSLVSRGSWLLYIAWSSYFIFVDMIFVREKNLKKASCAQPRFSLSKRFCPPKDGWFENEVFSETHHIFGYWSWKFETWIWEQVIKGVIGVWWANCNTPDLYTYIDGRTKKSIEVCRISSKE